MKRRSFLQSILGAIGAMAVPSVLAKPAAPNVSFPAPSGDWGTLHWLGCEAESGRSVAGCIERAEPQTFTFTADRVVIADPSTGRVLSDAADGDGLSDLARQIQAEFETMKQMRQVDIARMDDVASQFTLKVDDDGYVRGFGFRNP